MYAGMRNLQCTQDVQEASRLGPRQRTMTQDASRTVLGANRHTITDQLSCPASSERIKFN
jgi:hypothetical protein